MNQTNQIKPVFVNADVTNPLKEHFGPNGIMIPHLCNDDNVMGSGVARALYEKWPSVKRVYHETFGDAQKGSSLFIGITSFVRVEEDPQIAVANMIAQMGFSNKNFNTDRVNYAGLESCLFDVYELAFEGKFNIVMPKIGSLRAGGDWKRIYSMIQDVMKVYPVPTFIYEYKE